MEKMNTSPQRVDMLMQLSDHVYPAIDERIGCERRARRILRLGVNAIAHELEIHDVTSAGNTYKSILATQLARGGMDADSYQQWPQYAAHIDTLPHISEVIQNTAFSELANRYGDVKRATRDASGNKESDARHAVHLSSLALPYAAEFYPTLDSSRIAIYCLVHDILEAYTGDVPTLGITDNQLALKYQAEEKALKQLDNSYAKTWPEFVKIIHDYETLADQESRYVKTFDKLDPAFTHFSNKGAQLINFYGYTSREELLSISEHATKRIATYGSDFPLVLNDRMEITKRVADHTVWPATKTA